MNQQKLQRLEEIVEEKDKPYKSAEALRIALEDLDLNQSKVAEIMDCSTPTISNWYNKLDIESEIDTSDESQNDGDECIRCGRETTPNNELNNMCNDCLDYVREKDSNKDWNRDYPKEVVEV